jgi:hypothetical protein
MNFDMEQGQKKILYETLSSPEEERDSDAINKRIEK